MESRLNKKWIKCNIMGNRPYKQKCLVRIPCTEYGYDFKLVTNDTEWRIISKIEGAEFIILDTLKNKMDYCKGEGCYLRENCSWWRGNYTDPDLLWGRELDVKYKDGTCLNFRTFRSNLTTNQLIDKLPDTIIRKDKDGSEYRCYMHIVGGGVKYMAATSDLPYRQSVVYTCCSESLRKSVMLTLDWLKKEGYIGEWNKDF